MTGVIFMKERTMREVYPNELYHHGTLGMHWGVRKYQNPDGSLTPAGRARYLNARSLESQAEALRSEGHKLKAKTIERKASREMKKVDKIDRKWVNKQKNLSLDSKEYKNTEAQEQLKSIKKELKTSERNADGKYSKSAINTYNRKLADLMNSNISAIAPSGRVVKWVAKRGELGVMVGLADEGYDMNKLKNGVWSSGRVAYRKETIGKSN